jgi:hypothetical protein
MNMGESIYNAEYQKEYYKNNAEEKKTYQREYRLRNIDRIKKKDRLKHLRRNYGITGAQYEMMHASQNGHCAICGKAEWHKNGNLSIDHDHKTGKIRGLLCNWCNYGIGFLDNEKFMESARKYLGGDLR